MSVRVEVQISTRNQAFMDYPESSAAAALRAIADEIEANSLDGAPIFDVNGGQVGSWLFKVTEESTDPEEG